MCSVWKKFQQLNARLVGDNDDRFRGKFAIAPARFELLPRLREQQLVYLISHVSSFTD